MHVRKAIVTKKHIIENEIWYTAQFPLQYSPWHSWYENEYDGKIESAFGSSQVPPVVFTHVSIPSVPIEAPRSIVRPYERRISEAIPLSAISTT